MWEVVLNAQDRVKIPCLMQHNCLCHLYVKMTHNYHGTKSIILSVTKYHSGSIPIPLLKDHVHSTLLHIRIMFILILPETEKNW